MKAEYDPNKRKIVLRHTWESEEVHRWSVIHVAGPYMLAHVPWKRDEHAQYAVIRLQNAKGKVSTLYAGEAIIMFMVDAEGGRGGQGVRLGVLVDELFVAQQHPRRWSLQRRSPDGTRAKKKRLST